VPVAYYPTIVRYVPQEPIVQTIYVPSTGGENVPGPGAGTPLSQFEMHLRLGDYHFRKGEYAQASEEYKAAIVLEPENAAARYALADAVFALGDYHLAAYSLRRAIEIDPSWLDRRFDKRTYYGIPGDFDRQLRALEAYLADHPYDEAALLILGYNRFRSLDPMRAAADLERLLGVRTDDPVAKAILEATRRAATD
jgi:tetratricopeptide (TPR) repeat protein